MTRTRSKLALITAIVLVLAACGGDDGGTEETTTTTAAQATTTTPGGTDTTETTEAEGGEVAVPSSPDDGVTDDTIKIGFMGDITGPTAATQDFVNAGIRAYMDFVNQEGGVAGRQIEVITKDDTYAVEPAVTNFQALSEDDKVLAILGQGGSHIMTALQADIDASGIPFVGPQQTIDLQFEMPRVYNLLAHYGDQADVVVAKMVQDVGGAENLVVVSVGLEVASGEEWGVYVKDTVERLGGTYTEHLRVPIQGTDADAQVVRIKELIDSAGVNYIALHGSPSAALRLLNSMAAQGVDLPIGGIFAVISQNVYNEGPADLVDTFWGVNTYTPPNVSTPGNDEMNAFVEASGNGEYVEKSTNTNFVAGWVMAKVTVEAIRRAAETGSITRDSVAGVLDEMSGFETGGQSPVIDCTRSGHACGAAARPYVWDGSELVAEGDFEDWAGALDFTYGLVGG